MSHRRLVILLALCLGEAIIPLACAPAPAARAPVAAVEVPALGLAEPQPSSPIAPAVSASAPPAESATSVPTVVAAATEAAPPAPRHTAEADPPCIDGEILMGACICDRGMSADATGHCVLVPCPRTAEGRTGFRDPKTGQCMECRPGFRPTADGKCEP
jgi:hypothetical protein